MIELNAKERNVLRIIRTVKRQGGGSGGEMAIYNLIEAMIRCGLTKAAIGQLGEGWRRDIMYVVANTESLDRCARLFQWGEDPEAEQTNEADLNS